MSTKKSNDGMDIIKQRFGIDPRTDLDIQSFAEAFNVAQMVYDARERAGMTQKELAEAIGTTDSVVAALEAADYEGDSLAMLRRIAAALHMKLRLELVPAEQ
jgi:ribosome-binding protein aMBF1 (putative translation factor)